MFPLTDWAVPESVFKDPEAASKCVLMARTDGGSKGGVKDVGVLSKNGEPGQPQPGKRPEDNMLGRCNCVPEYELSLRDTSFPVSSRELYPSLLRMSHVTL